MIVTLLCADVEWQAARDLYPSVETETSPFGEWFMAKLSPAGPGEPGVFFHGGWGKIAAAASTQYVIDRWHPRLLVNLGTLGGFEGEIEKGTIILAEKTVVYDIVEQMGDEVDAIALYTTEIDLSWLRQPYPHEVRRTVIVSGDRDLLMEDLPRLKSQFGAVAGDWESGAIAWVAARNGARCLILRGVSDLVGPGGGEAYGKVEVFEAAARRIVTGLVRALPEWLPRIA